LLNKAKRSFDAKKIRDVVIRTDKTVVIFSKNKVV